MRKLVGELDELLAELKDAAETGLMARFIDRATELRRPANKLDWVVITIDELFDPESPG